MKNFAFLFCFFSFFLTVNGLFAQAGALDVTFGQGGKQVFTLPSNYDPLGTIIQPDGKILLPDGGGKLLRFLPNGEPDSTFGTGGVAATTHPIGGIALLPNGKIFSASNVGYVLALTKLMPDGKPDPSFSTDGMMQIEFASANPIALAILIASDSTVLIPFRLYSVLTSLEDSFGFIRLTSSGDLDTTIGQNGVGKLIDFNIDILASPPLITATKNDRIIFYFLEEGSDGTEHSSLYSMDFNGQLDPNFGNQGKVTFKFSFADKVTDIAAQPDNKIILTGSTRLTNGAEVFLLARFNPDGSLDSTFGVNGKATDMASIYENIFEGVALQADGKIIAVGTALVESNLDFIPRWQVFRFHANGARDQMFGTDGMVTTDFGDTKSGAFEAVIAPDNSIYVAGGAWIGGKAKAVMAKYLPGAVVGTNDLVGYDLQATVFPNPSSGQSFTLRYFLEKEGLVSLTLFNALGQVVSSLPENLWQMPGQQEHTWSLSTGLPFGTYYVRLETPDGTLTLPLLVCPK